MTPVIRSADDRWTERRTTADAGAGRFPAMKRAILLVLAVLAATAVPATAAVQPAGTGEPLFTNSANNTMWFEWSGPSSQYRIKYDFYANNALVNTAGPTVTTQNGTGWASWNGVASLQHGGQYGICAQGSSFMSDLWVTDGPNSCSMGTQLGRRAYTTIDRSKPSVATTLASGAGAIKTAAIPLHIDFADDIAGPFPANFLCVQAGDAPCSGIYGMSQACSQPQTPGKSTTFECTLDASELPDGPVSACIIAADAAIPDNPNGPDQSGSAASANHSDAKCDTIVLDRVAPTVAISDPGTTVIAGTSVGLTVSASDVTAGLTGVYAWDFGDGSPAGSGTSQTHTFATPGTYDVAVTAADAAGNTTTAHRSVRVEAPVVVTPTATATSTATATTTATATATPTSTATVAPTSTATTTPTATATTTAVPTPAPTAATLILSVPTRMKALKKVPVTLTTSAAGTARFAMVRGGRIEAQGATRLDAPGSTGYTLRLARKARRGKHQLTATFTTDGGSVTTRAATITVGRPKRHRTRAPRITLVGGTKHVLPDGIYQGPSD